MEIDDVEIREMVLVEVGEIVLAEVGETNESCIYDKW